MVRFFLSFSEDILETVILVWILVLSLENILGKIKLSYDPCYILLFKS